MIKNITFLNAFFTANKLYLRFINFAGSPILHVVYSRSLCFLKEERMVYILPKGNSICLFTSL
jgi:hypothetical protein